MAATHKFVPHTEMPPMQGPLEVAYCPIDGMPPDFCEFGGKFEEAKPWLIENYPHLYPELAGMSVEEAQKTADEKKQEKGGTVKELPGGKKIKEAPKKIVIKKGNRGGRKCLTFVEGLETFDIKLSDAAKEFKKKFACGCSAKPNPGGTGEMIEIQGDFEDELAEVILKKYKEVKEDHIFFGDAVGNVKGRKKNARGGHQRG